MELLYDGMGADLDNLAMRRSSVRGRLRDSGAGREKVGETRKQSSLSALRSRCLAGNCVCLRSRSQRIWFKRRRNVRDAVCPVKLARHSICRAQTSPGQTAGQFCTVCKFSFARQSADTDPLAGQRLQSAGRCRKAERIVTEVLGFLTRSLEFFDWNLYNISITGVSPVVGRMVK